MTAGGRMEYVPYIIYKIRIFDNKAIPETKRVKKLYRMSLARGLHNIFGGVTRDMICSRKTPSGLSSSTLAIFYII